MRQDIFDLLIDVIEHEFDPFHFSLLEVALDPEMVPLLLHDVELASGLLLLIVGPVQKLPLDQVQVDFLVLVLSLLLNCRVPF